MDMKKRKLPVRSIIFRTINITLVSGLGIFLVYYLLSRINISDLKSAILGVYIPSLVVGLILMFSIDFFKALRQNLLLGEDRVRYGDMFLISLIRNAFNMVLPARTGELSYVYVLKRKFKVPVDKGVSTLAIGLIFDLIIIFSMIIISIIIVGINRYEISSKNVILIAIGLLAATVVLLFFLSKIVRGFIKLFEFLLKKFENLKNKKVFIYVYEKLIEINKNIIIIQKRKIYWKVYLLSVITRILKFTSYYFLIHATLYPMGYTFADLSFWVIFLATVAAELSAVLPTHAIAGFGTYEGAFALTFIALGFSENISIIVGFNYHIINLVETLILGIIAMTLISLPFYRIRLKKTQILK
ncbi:MAG: lysylphosphatidylglycerol synthase transmembrane domain-containing protein [Actinomycetota bacterium]